MISQFVSPYNQRLLGHLNYNFPPGTQAVGRLDEDSEGLLILSTDKSLTRRLLHPLREHKRGYSVYVERLVNEETLNKMRAGLQIRVKRKGYYTTLPCKIDLVEKPAINFLEQSPFTEYVPHCWLQFELIEGKNRQIRKMCKAVRHQCKRLIRTSIEDLNLGNMKPGEVLEIDKDELFKLLRLDSLHIKP